MRALLILSLLALPSPALAYTPKLSPDPRIAQCKTHEFNYTRWAVDFRLRILDQNSSDFGGRLDASLIKDFNFALASAGDSVHRQIQYQQRASIRGEEPSVQTCRDIVTSVIRQIDTFARRLVHDVHPSDREGRDSILEEFRMELRESASEFGAY